MCTRVYLECSFWCWKPARAPAPAWTAKPTRNSVGIRAAYPGRNRPPRLIRVGHGGRSGSGHSHRRRRAGSRRGADRRGARAWRQRYQDTLRRLREAGVRLPAGLEAAWREYRHRRHGGGVGWIRLVFRLRLGRSHRRQVVNNARVPKNCGSNKLWNTTSWTDMNQIGLLEHQQELRGLSQQIHFLNGKARGAAKRKKCIFNHCGGS